MKIERLFGQYDYDLPRESDSFSEVAIFYGDNGCGKTTILRLLFHLLSSGIGRGHRTAISEVPFQLIQIDLHDGTRLVASRIESSETDAYSIRCESPSGKSFEVRFDRTDGIRPQNLDPDYQAFLSALDLSPYLLSADRELLSDALPGASDPDEDWNGLHRRRSGGTGGHAFRDLRRMSFQRAISGANEWTSMQAVRGTHFGSGSANEIYERIVKQIAESQLQTVGGESADADVLAQTLRELAARTEEFARYQLTSPLHVSSLIQHLSESEGSTRSIIARVLEPYIDATKARLDALVEVQRIAETFVRNCNDLFFDKELSFGIADGIQIKTRNGQPLDPDQLSSGEQELLMMFCHMIVSRDRASVFLIDEPELSLNVKWQRKLVDALLELVEGSEMQLVFATHSLELLAQHRQRVVHLSSPE